MKIIFDAACENYDHPGHPERPERISATHALLQKQSDVPLTWGHPLGSPRTGETLDDTTQAEKVRQAVLRAHTADHLARLDIPRDLDSDTPWHKGILDFALASAGAALAGLQSVMTGGHAFSLMRPPGHHATRNRAMGFCYLNNVAIAALEALDAGCKRVAVFDFDVHHGNGTEAILLDVPGAYFFSVHQFPCYPGTGTRNVGTNCFNFPVPPQTARVEHRHILDDALEHLKGFGPELILVSAGFDSYARDPLAQETLEIEDFHWLGGLLGNLRVPILSVLEGGYSADLPELILAYLKGLEGKPL